MRRTKQLTVCLALALAVSSLSARTVALWPLNHEGGKPDGGCALAKENNLVVNPYVTFEQDYTDIGWTLPPNIETRNWRFTPARTSAGYVSASSGAGWLFAKEGGTAVAAAVAVTNDFTLEGWIRMPELPASGQFFFIASGDGNNTAATSQRWFLTLRRNSPAKANTGVTWQIYSQRHNTGDAILATLDAEQVDSLTNGWHHFALSLRQRASDVIWRFYQDGVELGSKVASKCTGTVSSTGFLALGGRNVSNDRILKGSLSYCRLSDKALSPEEFLNYGGNTHRTVALWKLDRDAQGGISGEPSVGTAHLTGGFTAFHPWTPDTTAYSYGTFYSDGDCAFTGNPPNPTVILPGGNAGCLFSRKYKASTRLVVHEIGAELSLTNDFTVEGWLKLECRDFDHADARNKYANSHICGTRPSAVGWVFQVGKARGERKLRLFVQDGTGVVLPETEIGDISGHEGRWVHLALAYDHVGGDGATGAWYCYVDGTLAGAATNAVAPRDGAVDANSRRLVFGSQPENSDFVMSAKYDCWRASRAALQPLQLMCVTNGTAAADVLALWPMNVQNGIYIDGTDVVGTYTFEEPLAAQYMATACDGAPDVPGVSAAANGSVGFNVSGAASSSYVICNDAATVATLASDYGSTFEVYLYRDSQPTSGHEFIFIAGNGALKGLGNQNIGTQHVNLTYRPNGFVMFANGLNGNNDMQFLDGDGQPILLPLNAWTHLALTSRVEDGNYWFDLYLNGEKKGTIGTEAGTTKYVPSFMFLGGRYSTANSFKGKMSTLRISQGVLGPDEFLCARSATPESRAYWPLEGASALDLTGRIDGADGLNDFTVASGVSGLAVGARGRVPRPDTSANFTGDASANAGAVQMSAGGYAQAKEAGTYVDLDDSFAVEGWIRWTRSQGTVAEVICGTYADGKGGWKLVLDSTGATPTIRLHAEGMFPVSMLADGVLLADASSLEGEWRHLALRYDRSAGDGAWSLLVDGETVGSVTNAWRPSGIFDRAEFRLGAFDGDTSFVGGYDMWRISRGVRSVDDILWMPPKGTLMIFR